MALPTWLIVGASTVGVIGVGIFIATRTSWFKVRKYAVDAKRIFDKHKVQEKAEAVQQLSQNPNPNPVLLKKPLRELIATYQGLIADMEKLNPPGKARELHEDSLTMYRESVGLYQMAAVGGFRQKSIQDKQRKLQAMEKSLQAKMEKLYGPMKKPKK